MCVHLKHGCTSNQCRNGTAKGFGAKGAEGDPKLQMRNPGVSRTNACGFSQRNPNDAKEENSCESSSLVLSIRMLRLRRSGSKQCFAAAALRRMSGALAIARGGSGMSESPSEAGTTRKTPARVLIVDDDADFLDNAQAALEAHGFLVHRARGGLRGVFLATQDVPDAVLCDLRMPGIDGFVVAEALRSDPATRHMALFACTGRRDLWTRATLANSAFDAVLIKPVDWDEAARRLWQTINTHARSA
jgi:CheY-like chemotaxis protein